MHAEACHLETAARYTQKKPNRAIHVSVLTLSVFPSSFSEPAGRLFGYQNSPAVATSGSAARSGGIDPALLLRPGNESDSPRTQSCSQGNWRVLNANVHYIWIWPALAGLIIDVIDQYLHCSYLPPVLSSLVCAAVLWDISGLNKCSTRDAVAQALMDLLDSSLEDFI